jgi:hypothetical protein
MREEANELMNAIYKEETQEKIANTRNAFTDIATYILENLKDSREKKLSNDKNRRSLYVGNKRHH